MAAGGCLSTTMVEGSALIAQLTQDGATFVSNAAVGQIGSTESSNLPTPESLSADENVEELKGLIPESSEEASQESNLHHNESSTAASGKNRSRRPKLTVKLAKTSQAGRYVLDTEDPELRALLKRGLERTIGGVHKKSRFRDTVFMKQFTAFDRQNPESPGSLFHGFFSLFW